ncbi:MAG: FtsX-like permease family protein [Armatimonadota bacterium]
MNVFRLSIREITHRKLSFGLGLLSVVIAVGVLVGAVTLLNGHDLRTEQVIAEKQEQTREAMAKMEDDYRKIMKAMGYNVLILHEDQSFDEMHRLGYPTHYMPEQYTQRLADEKIGPLNHLLSVLQQKVSWPEMGREVLLTGIRGEVPITNTKKAKRPPLMDPVKPGDIKLGYHLANSTGLEEGETVTLRGRELRVREIYDQRGTQDDYTAWVSLQQAQEWMGRQGQINGILALECSCPIDELGRIEERVQEVLPDTRVREFSAVMLARKKARVRAAEAHEKAIEQEKRYRSALRSQRRAFASVLVPVTAIGAAAWIMFMMLNNVRERRTEIAILRAIGVSGRKIQSAFLLKALIMGACGGLIGLLAGVAAGSWLSEVTPVAGTVGDLVDTRLLIMAGLGAPVLTALASLVPARIAATQDPAGVLQEE